MKSGAESKCKRKSSASKPAAAGDRGVGGCCTWRGGGGGGKAEGCVSGVARNAALKRHVGAANVTGGVAALAAVVNTAATISAYPAGFTNLVKYLFAAAFMTLRHSYRLHPNRVSTFF